MQIESYINKKLTNIVMLDAKMLWKETFEIKISKYFLFNFYLKNFCYKIERKETLLDN